MCQPRASPGWIQAQPDSGTLRRCPALLGVMLQGDGGNPQKSVLVPQRPPALNPGCLGPDPESRDRALGKAGLEVLPGRVRRCSCHGPTLEGSLWWLGGRRPPLPKGVSGSWLAGPSRGLWARDQERGLWGRRTQHSPGEAGRISDLGRISFRHPCIHLLPPAGHFLAPPQPDNNEHGERPCGTGHGRAGPGAGPSPSGDAGPTQLPLADVPPWPGGHGGLGELALPFLQRKSWGPDGALTSALQARRLQPRQGGFGHAEGQPEGGLVHKAPGRA